VFLSNKARQFGFERVPTLRRPSQPFLGHAPSASTSTLSQEYRAQSSYAPSVYAQSTLAASTIMPGMLMQPVRNTETVRWVEGHCLQWRPHDEKATCSVCDEKSDEGIYRCTGEYQTCSATLHASDISVGCSACAHGRCANQIVVVCPSAFHADQVRAAFVRCFASLVYTYRRHLYPATGDQKKSGLIYRFKMDDFQKSLPHETADYIRALQDTQGQLAEREV
jgi:hypothetical protein